MADTQIIGRGRRFGKTIRLIEHAALTGYKIIPSSPIDADRIVCQAMRMGYKVQTTNPLGSDEAVRIGCTCPQMDNAYGRGYMGGVTDTDGNTVYVYSIECTVHTLNRRVER